jgi:hypothetical protein
MSKNCHDDEFLSLTKIILIGSDLMKSRKKISRRRGDATLEAYQLCQQSKGGNEDPDGSL